MEIYAAQCAYNELIAEARICEPSGKKPRNLGFDTHHIIPKSCGGTDSKDNIVVLSYEKHFEAHRLLKYMYPIDSDERRSMNAAFWMMCNTREGKRLRTPEEYAETRIEHAKFISEIHTGKIDSEETRKKKSKGAKIAQKKRFEDPRQRKLTSIATKLAMSTPEVRKLVSESHIGVRPTDETRRKQSLVKLGKKNSEETKSKMGFTRRKTVKLHNLGMRLASLLKLRNFHITSSLATSV